MTPEQIVADAIYHRMLNDWEPHQRGFSELSQSILKALRDAGVVREWLPIAEAPKDGRHILIHGDHTEIGYYVKVRDDEGCELDTWSGDPQNPTHFQHLPNPPEK